MKRFIVLAAGSLALVAGSGAFADCSYGKHVAAMADAKQATEEPTAEKSLSPELLALLKKQEEQKLDETLVVPNIPN